MKSVIEQIRDYSNALEQHTIDIRREIHSHPELSFHEFQTSELVCRELERIGIPYEKSPVAPGIIGVIDSGKPGKLLMLRADMDALPIQEETGLSFASQVPNVMHACGHDVHTANLLAVAEILYRMREQWRGRVKLVFQPAEEIGGGGREMIKAGLMDECPDACFALHVDSGEAGRIVAGSRYTTAYSDTFTCTVHGKAAHGSTPQAGVDAIYIASFIIQALYGILSRDINPLVSSTINIGLVNGGIAKNIIAPSATLTGTVRNLSKEARETVLSRAEALARGIAESMGGSCEFSIRPGYQAVWNDEKLTSSVTGLLKKNAGTLFAELGDGCPQDFLVTENCAGLGGEDFGFYSHKAPSCFLWIGMGSDSPKHSETFCVDERYIKLCTRTMASVSCEFLMQS